MIQGGKQMKISLKAARVNAGYTLMEAAKLLEINKETLSNYEHGKTFPTTKTISKIECLYKISYDNIIFLK
jgi:DNA-binding XRE family transcriptional regulator